MSPNPDKCHKSDIGFVRKFAQGIKNN